jgi:signal transduction histidine kinase/CheY-like chemotaxis protein
VTDPGARPLRRGLTTRLLLVLAVAVAALSVVVWVVTERANHAAADRRLADTIVFVAKRLAETDRHWNTQADVLRAQIDFARVLDEPDAAQRNARLSAFFAVLGGESVFTHAALLIDGQLAFRYGTNSQDALSPLEAGASGGRWVLGARDAVVYRAVVQPVLAGGRPGLLALYVPVDRAVLRANSHPGMSLALRWQGRELVAPAPGGAHARSAEIDWAGDPDGPRVVVTSEVDDPVGLGSALGTALLGGLAVALLGWAVLGRWLAHVAGRLGALQRASALFAAGQRVSPEIEQAIADAGGSGTHEIEALRAQNLATMAAVGRAQATLAQLNAHLEERVRERTAALEAARDDALAGTRAKEQFIATISHELRTPLVGLIGSLDLLQAGEQAPGPRELLGIARTSAEGLLGLINELLDFAKIEAGKLQLAQEPFDPVALVDDVVRLFSATARAKGLALHARVDGVDPDLRTLGDRSRLRQVLLNLASNAIKFTTEGTVVVHLEQLGSRDGRAQLRFAVEDSGMGISEADRERIFRPFEQAHRPRGSSDGGTGLGLAISQRLIGAMGGRIELASTPGRGSRFQFAVELAQAVGDTRPVPPTGEPAAGQPPLRGRVLVVDDNHVNRLVAGEMLGHMGLEVAEAEDGQEALDRIARERFDVVLMDCMMPGLDGFAATRRLREREEREGLPRLPVVALTANVMEGDLDRCAEAGMDRHLGKPFTMAELRAAVVAAMPVPEPGPTGADTPTGRAVA